MSTVGTRRGLGWALGAMGLCWAGAASAQPADAGPGPDAPAPAAAPTAELGAGALPGGARVGYAETLPAGVFAASFDGGFGYRSGLLDDAHKMKRGTAALGLAYGLTPWLSAALVFDGRFDSHKGGGTLTDDGWVGEPRLALRAARALGGVSLGGQLTLRAPGSDAPSVVPSALSVEALALVSGRASSGQLRWGLHLGGRLDNGGASIDDPGALSLADQASLGVSDYSALLVGGRVGYDLGAVVLGLDASADVYLGDGAPDPTVAIYATADYPLTPAWALTGQLGTHVVSSPAITMATIPLVPYDPQLVVAVGLVGRFGGASARATGGDGLGEGGDVVVTPPPPTTTSLSGVITDENGAPVAGAKVTIVIGETTIELVTDATGAYRADALPLGAAELTIEAPGRPAVTRTVELGAGPAPTASVRLEAPPLPTQLRGTVRSFRGTAIAATIKVTPGDLTVTAETTGEFELDLPAGGDYEVTVSAPGYVSQTRTITVTDRNVTIYNFDLRTP